MTNKVSVGIQSLAEAVDQRTREIWEDGGDVSQSMADSKDLGRALARILSGQSIRAAFGSPGDWGYNTRIGKALVAVYLEQASEQG